MSWIGVRLKVGLRERAVYSTTTVISYLSEPNRLIESYCAVAQQRGSMSVSAEDIVRTIQHRAVSTFHSVAPLASQSNMAVRLSFLSAV